jgi:hypothetical protein
MAAPDRVPSTKYVCKVCGNPTGGDGCVWVIRTLKQDEAHRQAKAAPTSRRVVPGDAARAVGRFSTAVPQGYRSSLGGPLRQSRDEAVADYAAQVGG